MAELPIRKRVAVRSPHGTGKTAMAAWLVLWAVMTADDVKAPTTASTWRHLDKFLWPEIHKWAHRLRWDRIGRSPFTRNELLSLALKLGASREAFAVASDNEAYIEGAHAERIMYVFDEAKTIPEPTWDAAEGAFSQEGTEGGAEAFALAISTPGPPEGRFYDIHRRKPGLENWWVRHITLEEGIEAGRIGQKWADDRAKQWGVTTALYLRRVRGEFAASDVDAMIPLSHVEAANARWEELDDAGMLPTAPEIVGADIGLGRDKTVLALRAGPTVIETQPMLEADTMRTTGAIAALIIAHNARAIVDVIGIGAGVVHRLREQGLDVTPFHAAEKTEWQDRPALLGFANKRSAAWWNMRELLDPANGEDIALPPDDELTGDLTAVHYGERSNGNIDVDSKDKIRKRLHRSTNYADAVIMAFWEGEDAKKSPSFRRIRAVGLYSQRPKKRGTRRGRQR